VIWKKRVESSSHRVWLLPKPQRIVEFHERIDNELVVFWAVQIWLFHSFKIKLKKLHGHTYQTDPGNWFVWELRLWTTPRTSLIPCKSWVQLLIPAKHSPTPRGIPKPGRTTCKEPPCILFHSLLLGHSSHRLPYLWSLTKYLCKIPNNLATMNQHPPPHREGWMESG
jgi:hypothetical protein